MKNVLLALVTLLPVSAFADKAISLGTEGNTLKNSLNVYVDADLPNVRCLCSRFSVALDDGEIAVGTMRTTGVLVIAKDQNGNVIQSRGTEELGLMFRSMNSPAYTRSQFLIMGNDGFAETTTVQVIGLHKKCMNPTSPECNEDVVSHYGEFKASQLRGLEPINWSELIKSN